MDKPNDVRITIAPQAIISVGLTLLGLWFLYLVRDILFLFLIVVAVVVTFSPIIRSWERYMPRTLAIVTLYVLLFLGVVLVTALLLPSLINQFSDFLVYLDNRFLHGGQADGYIQDIRHSLSLFLQGQSTEGLTRILTQFQGSLGAVYNTTLGFLGGVVAVLTVFVTSFYLLQEEKNLQNFLAGFLPTSQHKRIVSMVNRISAKMSNWLRGQLLLMVIVGILTGTGMAILGVPYPLVLGLFNGLMEAVPYVGPFIGAVPGIIIAFTVLGPVKGFIALAIYLFIQQIENQFLAPKIMSRALGLSPVIIIFALLTGGKLLGLVGVIIAIPIVAALSAFYEEWRKESE
ncbi:MAG TPA: AI-2E family transporter [Patescibacteria group bacterium]